MAFDCSTPARLSTTKVLLLSSAAAVLLTGCTGPGVTPSAPATVTSTQVVSGESGALVKARHVECNFGAKVMKYLSTGDNQGDPKLDKVFASHVGASAPEARQIVDDAIEKCDGAADARQATQASASAAAEASKARAAAESQASASASAARAVLVAKEEKACSEIGGRFHASTTGGVSDTCESPTSGANATDGSGTSCAYAQIAFKESGEMRQADIDGVKAGYPGCFR